MILGNNILGGKNIITTAIPPKTTYNKVKILGESYVDEMHIQNVELTDIEVINSTLQFQWGNNTIFLAHFDNNLEAGNFINSDMPITHWRISRRKVGESLFTQLAEMVNDGTTYYIDYKASSLTDYEYAIQALSNGIAGNMILGEMTMSFYGWMLVSQDGLTSFTFDMEVNTDNIQINRDRHQFDTYAQYPVISRGKQKFVSGKIECMPYEIINNNIEITNNVLESLEAFVENGQPKILKNGSGKIFLCDTFNFSYKYKDEVTQENGEQPYTISFEYVEIGQVV